MTKIEIIIAIEKLVNLLDNDKLTSNQKEQLSNSISKFILLLN